jgi:mRNA-degrading endonuclease YafQ of YafQ-DinJ toxin-antitoxin module
MSSRHCDLLLYQLTDETVIFVRTGSHSDLLDL